MARLIRCLKRTILSSSCSKCLVSNRNPIMSLCPRQNPSFFIRPEFIIARNYVSEMRKSAFEGYLLRLIRNEIQHELDHSPPLQPITKFGPFTVDDRPGEQWISLKRKFGENEDIKIESTMFDGSVPVSNSSAGVPEDVQLHITFIISISKGDDGEALEIMCSAWPDTIEITKLFIRRHNKTSVHAYVGPEFKELDDELQDLLYEFLEERGINDDLAVFLHQYMKNKDKTEFSRWMQTVKSYIERK